MPAGIKPHLIGVVRLHVKNEFNGMELQVGLPNENHDHHFF